jgi:hypothetical protein
MSLRANIPIPLAGTLGSIKYVWSTLVGYLTLSRRPACCCLCWCVTFDLKRLNALNVLVCFASTIEILIVPQITQFIRNNQALEKDLDSMDIKIGLLIKNQVSVLSNCSSSLLTKGENMLECLSVANLYRLVLKSEPTHLQRAPEVVPYLYSSLQL